jgi:hypothetical protein
MVCSLQDSTGTRALTPHCRAGLYYAAPSGLGFHGQTAILMFETNKSCHGLAEGQNSPREREFLKRIRGV